MSDAFWRRFRHAPCLERVRPHQDRAALLNLARSIPVGVKIKRIASSWADRDRGGGDAMLVFDSVRGRLPAFAADSSGPLSKTHTAINRNLRTGNVARRGGRQEKSQSLEIVSVSNAADRDRGSY